MNRNPVKTSLTNTNQGRAASEARLRAMPGWPHEVEGWRRVLSECEQKPTRKRIHALRVATLRLQAQFGRWLDEHKTNHPAMQAVNQWNKQAKQLRRALGAVRNCDIYAAKLAGVRSTLTTAAGYEPRTSRTSLRQIGEVERRIKRDRRVSAEKLREFFAERRQKFEAALLGIDSAVSPHLPLVPQLDLDAFTGMCSEAVPRFSTLDAEDLHDLRKRIKTIRYLAELMSGNDPRIAALAAELKALQGAIGEWHDWDELTQEAARALRREAKNGNLIEHLETMSEASLEKALETSEIFRARFATEHADPAEKKRVRSASPAAVGADAVYA
jgi:CHAD domain-containing protein